MKNITNKKKKLIVILGPNASGKTDISIKLAKKFNGEIISADSRQVYKKMNIGTGKITKKEMNNIPHYLLDVVEPKTRFTVSKYQKLANKAIKKIFKNNKIPFIVGGTGFYIDSVIDGVIIPAVKPDWKLRKKLEKENIEKLFKMLKKLDPKRAGIIESKNKRRLIRAIEIIIKTKKPVPLLKKIKPKFDVLILGIKKEMPELKKRIEIRLLKRLKSGMIAEVKKLKQSGVSWKRLEEFGLEYKYIALFLQNKLTKDEMITKLQKEIEHYAKRQRTWFKRDKRIHWVKNYKQSEQLIKKFLK
ncbi:MAG: tRNA (adenosine(37)-N6)-dimethylallyltransferase MiaA [Candidatus Nealsonbacteria bacterium]